MFLVKVRHQVLGTAPALLPCKKFHKANVKDLAEWCQAFERACANAGWLRQPADRMQQGFLASAEARADLGKHNLAPQMVLRRVGNHKDIVIEIENLETLTPAQAASAFTG